MASRLPDYVASAKPVPQGARTAWFKNTAQTYAGIMLWFVFWHQVPLGSELVKDKGYSAFAGGTLAQGLGVAFLGLILAALICHFLFYVVPGLLGMKTGLPLYIVGTSTYGVQGGFLMPGFLMGVLQFGWLAVNAYFAGVLLCMPFKDSLGSALPVVQGVVAAAWAVAGAFMGLKGIKYVARVATFLPIIPLVVLVILFFATIGGLGKFDSKKLIDAGRVYTPAAQAVKAADEAGKAAGAAGEALKAVTQSADPAKALVEAGTKAVAEAVEAGTKLAEEVKPIPAKAPLTTFGVIALIATYVVGFFATAGAAGADFGMNNRDKRDVQLGGLVGIALATVLAGGLSLLIVAGAHGMGKGQGGVVQTTNLMGGIMGSKVGGVFMYLLAIAAFPPACFSSFIAANSFKTTLPKVNPFISCGIGTVVAIILAVTGWAGDAIAVFSLIGASFGPVCGAMMADYLLSGCKWPGPRAGWNLAGWISWVVGFIVGAADFIPPVAGKVPCPPVAAFIVGFVLYLVLAKAGLQSKTISMEGGAEAAA